MFTHKQTECMEHGYIKDGKSLFLLCPKDKEKERTQWEKKIKISTSYCTWGQRAGSLRSLANGATFTSIFHRIHLHLLWPSHSTSLPHLSPTSVCVCAARIMTALIRDVPNGWSCSVKAERKREAEQDRKTEGVGPERDALCCNPPRSISQSNIHLGCRLPASRTLSKTNLLRCFFFIFPSFIIPVAHFKPSLQCAA